MTYFFQLPQYFARQILADGSLLAPGNASCGAIFIRWCDPCDAYSQFKRNIAGAWKLFAEQPVTGLCTTLGDNSGFGAIPSWDVSNVNNFDNAFNIKTTFNGDVSRWDMSNATSQTDIRPSLCLQSRHISVGCIECD